jgi:hypothetical protein
LAANSCGSVISVVAQRAATVAKVARVPGLAQHSNETLGDAPPLCEFLILLRLRFNNWPGRLLCPGFPTPTHCTAFQFQR